MPSTEERRAATHAMTKCECGNVAGLGETQCGACRRKEVIPPYDRDELARVIEVFVEGGSDLSGPRDLDVLLDAIAECFRGPA